MGHVNERSRVLFLAAGVAVTVVAMQSVATATDTPDLPTVKAGTVAASAAASPGRDLQIVAHEDDDIIFMNPDIQDSIASGNMVRTVWVTAGNVCPNGGGTCSDLPAGVPSDTAYWHARERGALAAYATMAGKITTQLAGTEGYRYFHDPKDFSGTSCTPGQHLPADGGQGCLYTFQTRTLPGSCGAVPCTVDVWTLRHTPVKGQVSLVFLRVSAASGGSTMWPLEKLWQGSLSTVMTVGPVGRSFAATTADKNCDPVAAANPAGCRTYTKGRLTSILTRLIADFRPTRVRIQDAAGASYTSQLLDHTDHLHAARWALNAYWRYLATSPGILPRLRLYRGYYVQELPENVPPPAYAQKTATLDNYCVFDPPTGGPGCYQANWAPRQYSLAATGLRGRITSMLAQSSGMPGCLGFNTGQRRVRLGGCGADASRWSTDRSSHLGTVWDNGRRLCLTIPDNGLTPGTTSSVRLGPCDVAGHWRLLGNGMLVGDNSKVLRATADGTVGIADLFTYVDDINNGGSGNLAFPDTTDTSFLWAIEQP